MSYSINYIRGKAYPAIELDDDGWKTVHEYFYRKENNLFHRVSDENGELRSPTFTEEFVKDTGWERIDENYDNLEEDERIRIIDAQTARKMAVRCCFNDMLSNLEFGGHYIDFTKVKEPEETALHKIKEDVIHNVALEGGNPHNVNYYINAGALDAFKTQYIRTVDLVYEILEDRENRKVV